MTRSKLLDVLVTSIGGCALITTLMLLVEKMII